MNVIKSGSLYENISICFQIYDGSRLMNEMSNFYIVQSQNRF